MAGTGQRGKILKSDNQLRGWCRVQVRGKYSSLGWIYISKPTLYHTHQPVSQNIDRYNQLHHVTDLRTSSTFFIKESKFDQKVFKILSVAERRAIEGCRMYIYLGGLVQSWLSGEI